MLQNVFQIKVDLKKKSTFVTTPEIVQNDNVRFEIEVTDNGKPLALDNVQTVSLAHSTKDETVVTSGEIEGNKVIFNLGTLETKYVGQVNATVQLYDAEGRISTIKFPYYVVADPTGKDYVPSEKEQTLIEVVMAEAQAKIDELSQVDVVDLKAKQDEFTAELAQIAKVEHIVPEPDGINDRQIINAAISYAGQNGFNVKFPANQHYKLNVNKNLDVLIPLTFDDMTIDLNGSLIEVETNHYTGYYVMHPTNVKGILIKNGVLKGDRLTHDYSTIEHTHEFGYGVYSLHSSVTVRDMEIYDMTGDAVITKDDFSNTVRYIDSHFHHCRRQGLSVLNSDRVFMLNCHIHDIGTSDGVMGTGPSSGIDLEPNSGTNKINHFEMTNCRVEDCDGFGMVGNDRIQYALLNNVYINSGFSIHFAELHVHNSTLVQDRVHRSGHNSYIDATKAVNSNFIFELKDTDVNIIGEYDSCYFLGASETLGDSTRIGGTVTISNSTLENIMGTSLKGRGGFDNSSQRGTFTLNNNRLKKCSLMFNRDTLVPKNKFLECDIYINTGLKVVFNGCDFIDCDTTNNFKSIVEMNNCYLKGNDLFNNAAKIIKGSTIKITSLTSLSTFNYASNNVKSLISNSTLKIVEDFPNMEWLPRAYNTVFELNELKEDATLPTKCVNCVIITGLEVENM